MKKTCKGFIAGVLFATLIVAAVPGIAKDAAETITAVYRNIKLVVDGVEVEPKDANGNKVEPFIYNGTTYLPVRAVATAFDKEVVWDGENAVVYLGGEVDKPAKELALWDRSYLETSSAKNVKAYSEKGVGYISCNSDWSRCVEYNDDRRRQVETITYPLNSLAKTLSGEFYMKGIDSSEAVLRIYDTNGKKIYESPIMRDSTAAVPFNVNVENEISVTFEFEYLAYYSNGASMHIKNPTIVSADY